MLTACRVYISRQAVRINKMTFTENYIRIRQATWNDFKFLFMLRNLPKVYKYCRTPRKITKVEHTRLLSSAIFERLDTKLFIIECNFKPVGQIRFYIKDIKTAEVNISLLPKFRNIGIGTQALKKAMNLINIKFGITNIIAEVHKANKTSILFFQNSGWHISGYRDKWIKYYFSF